MPTFLMTVPAASLVRVTRMFGGGYQRNSSAFPRPDPRGSCVRHWRSSTGRSPGRASPLAPVADLQRADIERHNLTLR